jgi:uncharacterized membrane protein
MNGCKGDDEMIGCLIAGSLAVMALSRLAHRRWCHGGWHGPGGWHHGGGWHGRWHRHHHGHRGGFGAFDLGGEMGSDAPAWSPSWDDGGYGVDGKRYVIRAVLRHVQATPAQERVIAGAFSEFADELKRLGGGEGKRSRQEIADALRRPTFDGVALGEQFARHDTLLEQGRKAFVGLFAKIHDTLEEEQRARLADLVQRGRRFGWWSR